MPRAAVSLFIAGALAALSTPVLAQQPVIAAIQVHGNTFTPDDDVIQASGLSVGAPFSDALLKATADRLAASKRFQHVDVLKRYASITDPTQIVVLIRMDEGPVHLVPSIVPGQAPRVAKRNSSVAGLGRYKTHDRRRPGSDHRYGHWRRRRWWHIHDDRVYFLRRRCGGDGGHEGAKEDQGVQAARAVMMVAMESHSWAGGGHASRGQ